MRTTTITATGAARRDCARRGTEAKSVILDHVNISSPAAVQAGFLLYGHLAEGEQKALRRLWTSQNWTD